MKTRPVILAVDCSTTAGKAVAFELDGTTVAETRQYLSLAQPRPGWFEQDAEHWWSACADALASVMSMLGDWVPIAVCVTHQRESFVLLDRRGVPVRPAILWVDGRARQHATRIGTPEIHRLTGKPPSPVPSLYKLAWLREHEPANLARTATIMDVHGFLVQRLTGRRVTSTASGDSTGLMSLATRGWVEDLVELAGLDPSQLPELVEPGTLVGAISVDASRRTGIPVGTPVVAGAGDGQCAALGTGSAGMESYYLNAGTSLSLGLRRDRPEWGSGYRTFISPVAGGYDLETLVPAAGLALDWLVTTHLQGAFSAAELARDAERVPIGCNGLSFLPGRADGGTTADAGSPGVFLDRGGAHSPPEYYRAVIEGLVLEQLDRLDGLPSTRPALEQLHATGGVASLPVFGQAMSDVLGCPVAVAREREGTALGAAIIAAASPEVDAHDTLASAAAHMARPGDTYTPGSQRAERWDQARQAQQDARRAQRDARQRA